MALLALSKGMAQVEAVEFCSAMLPSIHFRQSRKSFGAGRANTFSPVPPTGFRRFRLFGVPPLARRVLERIKPARDLDDVTAVADLIRNVTRHHVVAEHLAPAADVEVGGDDRRTPLIACQDELEERISNFLAYVDRH